MAASKHYPSGRVYHCTPRTKCIGAGRSRYNSSKMNPLIALGMHIVATMFLVGIVGSAVVVVISFIEDLHELLGE